MTTNKEIFVKAVTVGAIIMGAERGDSWAPSVVVEAHFVPESALEPTEEEKGDSISGILCSRATDYLAYEAGRTERPDWLKESENE